VQRQRVTAGADAALAAMFGATIAAPSITTGADLPVVELEVDRSARPVDSVNAEESTWIITERSTSDLPVPALTPAPADPSPYDLFAQEESAPTVAERSIGRAAVMAADKPVRRRATGRVPQVARSAQPRRTKDELLAEARQLTESWPVDQLTADGIRKALRTSPEKGRWLRDTLKGERGEVA
ncbi:conjugal transfer protein, partial [Streptomyces sp. SID6041]|nr:conjugal transfer protein [Streptomyces sp. SID6041]